VTTLTHRSKLMAAVPSCNPRRSKFLNSTHQHGVMWTNTRYQHLSHSSTVNRIYVPSEVKWNGFGTALWLCFRLSPVAIVHGTGRFLTFATGVIDAANSAGLKCVRVLSTLGGCCAGLADRFFQFCAIYASRVVSSNTGVNGLIFVANIKILVYISGPLSIDLWYASLVFRED